MKICKKDLTLDEFRNWISSNKNHSQFGLLNYIANRSDRIAVSNRSYGLEETVFLFIRFGPIRWQGKKGFIDGQYHIIQLLWEDFDGSSC
ncbi:MAG: hypothetical protein WC516_04715 [Patescibacteria group bacterium]